MDVQALHDERKELFENAFDFKHNKRVPSVSNFFTWKILDAGYTLKEAIYDYEIMEKVMREFIERYKFDAYLDVGTRNPIRVTDAFGGGYHYIDEENEAVLIDDHHILEREEYREFIENPAAFYWTKGFKRSSKPGITVGELKNAVLEFLSFGQFSGKMNQMLFGEYGGLLFFGQMGFHPFEQLFNTLRGIKEVSLDVRKCKAELKDCMDVIFNTVTLPSLEGALVADDPNTVAATSMAFLGHSVLSVKQFEELYWPYCKIIIDKAIAAKKRISVMCEAEMIRFAEFFQDVPKGVLMIQLEQDDVFEFRKKLPNISIVGGMPTNLLGYGTKQQNVDYAKKLIDELGEGYVFSTDKMMSYRNDAKRENLVAVCDFVREYQL
jgi:hypothetical protein